MELLSEKLDSYQKNLQCIQEAADQLLSCMKGHGYSFKADITDSKGNFSHEKLCALVEEILSLWETKLRDGTFTDPDTGTSLAEPYIQARRELYGSYLYLVMRCSLLQGAYTLAWGGTTKEQADFAFLLKHAKYLSKDWCVVEEGGEKRNELFFSGYDRHFGFHLYKIFSCPAAGTDYPMTLEKDIIRNCPRILTGEGYRNLLSLKKVYCSYVPEPWRKKVEDTAWPEEDEDNTDSHDIGDEDNSDSTGSYDAEDDYDREDRYDIEEEEDDYDYDDYVFMVNDYWEDLPEEYAEAAYEEGAAWAQKQADLDHLILTFEHQEEYLAACRCFEKVFRKTKPDILWNFYRELEEIVDLYLAARDISPLMDTDKTLDIYNSICDGPYRHARRYERGIQWKNL